MGHAIYTDVCGYMLKERKSAVSYADYRARTEGDYHSGLPEFEWHDKLLPCYEDAEKFIEENDGWYKCLGVSYYEPTTNAKIKALENRIAEERKKKFDYSEKNHKWKTTTAKFVGCKECGSKFASQFLRTDKCPMCRAELRSDTIINRLNKYDEKIRELESELLKAKRTASKKNPKWLIKYEFHV